MAAPSDWSAENHTLSLHGVAFGLHWPFLRELDAVFRAGNSGEESRTFDPGVVGSNPSRLSRL